MNVKQFLEATGMNIHKLSQEAGVAYSTLHPHVRKGKKLGEATARKLEAWSKGRMKAAEILELSAPVDSRRRP
ncbi:hypothetical protein WMF30_14960 [Sorangium sp. So ce134]